MYCRTTATKSASGFRPSRCARSALAPRAQLATMPAIIGSGTKRTRSRTARPATASSASSMSLTRTFSAGRFSAVRPPNASCVAS
jgi:hypothetical protein